MRGKLALGYFAGLLAGVAYGTNPMFGKPLFDAGVSVLTMLFFRYLLSAMVIGGWMLFRRERMKVTMNEFGWLMLLGLLFATSSLTLFASYCYIPSGFATTLIYLYPVFVALLMTLQRVFPTRQTWISIFVTFVGVALLCSPDEGISYHPMGVSLAILSALSYACYFVIVNSVEAVKPISPFHITFYSLLTGAFLFLVTLGVVSPDVTAGLSEVESWLNLLGLAIVPTTVSTLALTISTRLVGATKASVLGVTEPITSIVIGTILFAEPFTLNVAVGVFLCIAAIVFMIVSPSRKEKESA